MKGLQHQGRSVRWKTFRWVPYRSITLTYRTGSLWSLQVKGKWLIFHRRIWSSWFANLAMNPLTRPLLVRLHWWKCYRVACHRLSGPGDDMWKLLITEYRPNTTARFPQRVSCSDTICLLSNRWEDKENCHMWLWPHRCFRTSLTPCIHSW